MTPLWLTHGYPSPPLPSSGAFIAVQARALARNHIPLEVVSPVSCIPAPINRLSDRWRAISSIPAVSRDGQVTVHRPRYFAHPRENRIGMPHRFMLRAVRRLNLARPALIHAHSGVPHGWVAMQLARAWGVPYAITLLGSDVGIFAKANEGARRRFAESVRGAGAVFAVGAALARETEAMTGRLPQVLHYGVDHAWLEKQGDKAGARARLGLPEGAFIGLFVGQLSQAKGVADLAHAIARLGDAEPALSSARWLFVGDGPLRPVLEGSSQCRVAGAVRHDKLCDYYDAADVLFLPSYHEGLPTVILEAGSRGLPVAASDVGSVRDVVSDATGWLLRPGDAEGLLTAMRKIPDMRTEERRARGARLKRLVVENYSARTNAGRLLDAYRRLGVDLG